MKQIVAQLRTILTRRAKISLLVAALASIMVALLDTVAVALVLPLVTLATGGDTDSGPLALISDALGNPSTDELTAILAVSVVALFVLKDAGSLVFLWWLSGFVQTERVRTSARILKRLLDAPYSETSSRSSAEMMRTADAAVLQVFSYTINGLMLVVTNTLALATMLIALAVLAPWLTLILIAYFGVAGLAFDRIARPRAVAAGEVLAEASMQGYRTALGALGGLKEIKLRGAQEHFVNGFREAQLKGAYAGRTAGFINGLPRYLLEVLFILAVGLIVLTAAVRGEGQSGAIGVLALFVAAGFRLLPAISALLANISNIRVGIDPLRLVHREVVAGHRTNARPATDGDAKDAAKGVCLAERLTLEGVSFRYPNTDAEVLRDVWLDVPRGTSLALTGGSGAGKTTLVDILLGLQAPTAGYVRSDGRNIQDGIEAWQRQVGYVAQDVFLLDATLAENVAFDQPLESIDFDRVQRALRQAQLEEVVNDLPNGLHSQLGERGARLSGGQRQRVGIARALYRDCKLLVLDEATSALDNETESKITEIIRALHGEMTVILVAHRLSTVRHADQIVHLERGAVSGVGSFAELIQSSAGFANLVRLGSLELSTPDTSASVRPASS